MRLLVWWQSRAWKRQANDAVAAAHVAGERQRLAAAIVAHLAADAPARSPARVESAALSLLNDKVVRLSLALRYLQSLQDRISHGDYEDVAGLRAEMVWARGHLAARFRSPLLAGREKAGDSRHEEIAEPLRVVLTAQVEAALQGATAVAA